MKKIKKLLVSVIIVLISVFAFNSIALAAEEKAPNTIKTGENTLLNAYIEGAPKVYYKTLPNGVWAFCQNEPLYYFSGYTMKLKGEINEGFNYILENRPNTGDIYKDFYAMQIAVWWYEDILNNNNVNIPKDIKTAILKKVNTDTYSRIIYNLVNGAKNYKQDKTGSLEVTKDNINFTLKDGYYVSDEIVVTTSSNVDISSVISEGLDKSIITDVKKVSNTKTIIIVKVPENITKGLEVANFAIDITGGYNIKKAYNYFYTSEWQNVIYGKTFNTLKELTAHKDLSFNVKKDDTFEVKISKTDITKQKEIPGAKLSLVCEDGTNLSWTSTNESHKVTLKPTTCTLTEVIAPKGYILSKDQITFKLDSNGKIYEKNVAGEFVLTDHIKMVNLVREAVNISKLDSKTNEYVKGASLVIKNNKGESVAHFTTTGESYYINLDAGIYTLEETNAPEGYELNPNVITFKVDAEGKLSILNASGVYENANGIIFYNTPVTIIVPKTGISNLVIYIAGAVILGFGVIYLIRNEKKC